MKRILLSLTCICFVMAAQAQMRLPANAFASAYAMKFPSTETIAVQVNTPQASSPIPHSGFSLGTSGVVSSTTGIVVQEELVAGKKAQWLDGQRIERFIESRRKHTATVQSGGGNK